MLSVFFLYNALQDQPYIPVPKTSDFPSGPRVVTRPNWAREVRELIRVPRGQGVGLQGPRGAKGRPSGSQGVNWCTVEQQ